MARHRRQTTAPAMCFVLDSGALIGESRGHPRLRALIREALGRGIPLIVPPIVITETYRADPTDANLNRLLGSIYVPETGFELAKVAGRLLAVTGASNAADAQVVAEALRRTPCTILTSDYDDIDHLVDGRRGIIVQDVGKL